MIRYLPMKAGNFSDRGSLYGELAVCPDNLPLVTPEMTKRGISTKASNDNPDLDIPVMGDEGKVFPEQLPLGCNSVGTITIVQAAE